MSLANMFKNKLTPELFQQVQDSLGDDFNWDYVPRTRLNSVIAKRNELQEQLLSLNAGDSDKDTDSTTGSTPPTKKVDSAKEIETLKAQYEKEMLNLQLRYSLTDKLREAGCRKPELLLDKFSTESLKLTDDGLTGYEDTLKKWQTSDPYLFAQKGEDVPEGTGRQGGAGGQGKGKDSKIDSLLESIFGEEMDEPE